MHTLKYKSICQIQLIKVQLPGRVQGSDGPNSDLSCCETDGLVGRCWNSPVKYVLSTVGLHSITYP